MYCARNEVVVRNDSRVGMKESRDRADLVVTAFFKKHRKRVFTEINIDSFLSLMFVVLLRIQRKNEISFL